MLWAKFAWGDYWSGDPKQNASAIGLLMYFAYLVLRGSITDPQQRGRIGAVYNIFAFAAFIPLSAVFAEKFGRRATSIGVCIACALFGLVFSSMLESGSTVMVFLFLCLGLSLMGMTYGPIGTVLSEIFPTSVRYTGSALTFNLAGIFGASFAPLIATKLATTYGLQAVGYYLTAASILSLLAFLAIRETKNDYVK